jgi:phosphomannomutase
MVLEIMSMTGKPLSQLVQERISLFPSSGEINRKLTNPASAIKSIEARYRPGALSVDYTDGLSMEFDKWRFNLRSSNTEPVVRLNVESRGDEALMKEKTSELLGLIGSK